MYLDVQFQEQVGWVTRLVLPRNNWKFVLTLGWRWRLRLQVFLLLEEDRSAVFLVTAVVAVLLEQRISGRPVKSLKRLSGSRAGRASESGKGC